MPVYVRHKWVCRTVACVVLYVLLGLPLSAGAEESKLLERRLDAYLLQHRNEMAGLAAIILQKDRVIVRLEGHADIERRIPVDPDTVFEWGSVSKLLVWISILQLAEAGKVDVDEDILSYLPSDFRTKSTFTEPVTLSSLMHHTAGYDDSFTDMFLHQQAEVHSLRKVLEQADVRQVFPPGEVVSYSNYGSALAAYVVEEVSGLDYREYVSKNIFGPLNMTKTAIDPAQNDNLWVKERRGRVQGYSPSRQLIEPNKVIIPLYPAGSTMGTAGDLQVLLETLLTEDGSPLFTNKRTVDQLVTPSLTYPGTEIPRIASGLFYLPSESQHVFGHGGNTKSFSSSVYVDRNEQTGVLVLTNTQYDSVFTAGIPELIFGKYAHPGAARDLEDASRWTGIYEPARVPRHGFSKVYGLLVRSRTEQTGLNDLAISGYRYAQLDRGVYLTTDAESLYSLDVYSNHPLITRMLSNTYSDLLRVSYTRHYLEGGGLILAVLAAVYSLIYVIIALYQKLRHQKGLQRLILALHTANLLMVLNMTWLLYRTSAMTSYSSLQPFLTANLLYLGFSLVSCGLLLAGLNRRGLSVRSKRSQLGSVLVAVTLCANALYWEVYF